ncbi:hypothetical protein GH721_05745 [Kriegella sp. EG-1]|nr:hypothetical protein [Flavobacteriaceae bacterium EG-1]
MKDFLAFTLIAIFSIFLGSQITEGVLLVPYWQSLSPTAFYEYYDTFGSVISRYYSFLTIIAVLIPFSLSIYCYYKRSDGLRYSFVSSFFAILIITIFYIYFKETNQLFHARAFDTDQLKTVLNTWEFWHWSRVFFEIHSLIFLILTFNILKQNSKKVNAAN